MITEHRLRVLRAAVESLTEGIDGVESVSAFSTGEHFSVIVSMATEDSLRSLSGSLGGKSVEECHDRSARWLRGEAKVGGQPVTLYGPMHSLVEAEVQS